MKKKLNKYKFDPAMNSSEILQAIADEHRHGKLHGIVLHDIDWANAVAYYHAGLNPKDPALKTAKRKSKKKTK